MNINEQIEAAWQEYRGEETYTPDYPVKASNNFADGFKSGARWALSLPLAERLTEDERNKIKDMYWDALKEWIGVGDAREHCRVGIALENIFGIEMFKNK